MRGEMSKLSEIERNKDLRTGKLRKFIRKYKITNAINITSIKAELKEKTQIKYRRKDDLCNKFYRNNKIF